MAEQQIYQDTLTPGGSSWLDKLKAVAQQANMPFTPEGAGGYVQKRKPSSPGTLPADVVEDQVTTISDKESSKNKKKTTGGKNKEAKSGEKSWWDKVPNEAKLVGLLALGRIAAGEEAKRADGPGAQAIGDYTAFISGLAQGAGKAKEAEKQRQHEKEMLKTKTTTGTGKDTGAQLSDREKEVLNYVKGYQSTQDFTDKAKQRQAAINYLNAQNIPAEKIDQILTDPVSLNYYSNIGIIPADLRPEYDKLYKQGAIPQPALQESAPSNAPGTVMAEQPSTQTEVRQAQDANGNIVSVKVKTGTPSGTRIGNYTVM